MNALPCKISMAINAALISCLQPPLALSCAAWAASYSAMREPQPCRVLDTRSLVNTASSSPYHGHGRQAQSHMGSFDQSTREHRPTIWQKAKSETNVDAWSHGTASTRPSKWEKGGREIEGSVSTRLSTSIYPTVRKNRG